MKRLILFALSLSFLCACSQKSVNSASSPIQSEDQISQQTQSERIPAPVVSEFWQGNEDLHYAVPNKKYIAFTFDDSPAKTLESILSVFASFNETHPDCKANATLFLQRKTHQRKYSWRIVYCAHIRL